MIRLFHVLLVPQANHLVDLREKYTSPQAKVNTALEHLQEFAKFYFANLVFCQPLKRYAK
jgi:hypothetical protein